MQTFEVAISNKRWFPWESVKFESLVLFELFVCGGPYGQKKKIAIFLLIIRGEESVFSTNQK